MRGCIIYFLVLLEISDDCFDCIFRVCTFCFYLCFRYISQTHYETLGIEKSASQAEVRSAFLSLSKKVEYTSVFEKFCAITNTLVAGF